MTDAPILNRNEINERLILISGYKWEGLNCKELVGAVAKTIRAEPNARTLLESESNSDQIAFAKMVWNNGVVSVRDKFTTMPNNWFVNLSTDSRLTPILAAALERYQATIRGSNPEGQAAYDEIVAKVNEWRPHVERAAEDMFYEPQPGPGIIRMIEKFDRLARENNGPIEPHFPNESAVTYPFILGKMLVAMNIDFHQPIGQIKILIDDVLKFVAIHGQRTVGAFTTKVSTADAIPGPDSGVDLKPFLQALIDNEDFTTAVGASGDNKYTPNHKMTLKRIVRLVYICSKYKTTWGLMGNQGEFVEKIVELYNLENEVQSPDMNSLAMIWYLAIGRGNICAIMVDHWEKSASNALADLLGREGQNVLEPPDHVFPLNKSTSESF